MTEDAVAMVARCLRGQAAEYVHPFSVLTPAEWREVSGHGQETIAGGTPEPIPEEPSGHE